jgi:hypothetical protein
MSIFVIQGGMRRRKDPAEELRQFAFGDADIVLGCQPLPLRSRVTAAGEHICTALGRGAQRLRCRASYEQARGSDFAKLAKLSAEGRSSAMSLVMASIVRTLRTWEGDLDDRARKLLAFVDNRQDAPLQIMTGHISSPPLQMEARR